LQRGAVAASSSLRLCAGHLGYEIRLALETGTTPCLSPSVARVVVGRPPDDLGAASLSAPATAGAIALISGHALHLVVRLVLEKVPGRLPCPFIMRLGTFRSEEEQGLPIGG